MTVENDGLGPDAKTVFDGDGVLFLYDDRARIRITKFRTIKIEYWCFFFDLVLKKEGKITNQKLTQWLEEQAGKEQTDKKITVTFKILEVESDDGILRGVSLGSEKNTFYFDINTISFP